MRPEGRAIGAKWMSVAGHWRPVSSGHHHHAWPGCNRPSEDLMTPLSTPKTTQLIPSKWENQNTGWGWKFFKISERVNVVVTFPNIYTPYQSSRNLQFYFISLPFVKLEQMQSSSDKRREAGGGCHYGGEEDDLQKIFYCVFITLMFSSSIIWHQNELHSSPVGALVLYITNIFLALSCPSDNLMGELILFI